MAYTVSMVLNTVMGNKRVVGYKIGADAASSTVQTPLGNIEGVMGFAVGSCTTAGVAFTANEGAAGTSTAGRLHIEGATSGDDFYVTVYGS